MHKKRSITLFLSLLILSVILISSCSPDKNLSGKADAGITDTTTTDTTTADTGTTSITDSTTGSTTDGTLTDTTQIIDTTGGGGGGSGGLPLETPTDTNTPISTTDSNTQTPEITNVIENVSIIMPQPGAYSTIIPIKVTVTKAVGNNEVPTVGARFEKGGNMPETWIALEQSGEYWQKSIEGGDIPEDGEYTIRINATIKISEGVYDSNTSAVMPGIIIDKTVPEVTLVNPAQDFTTNVTDQTISNDTQINFTMIVKDENIANATIYINGEISESRDITEKDAQHNFTKTLTNGTHTWSVIAYDKAGMSKMSEQRTINIIIPTIILPEDAIPPNVTNANINTTTAGENESINISIQASDESGISTVMAGATINITMNNIPTGSTRYEAITMPRLIGCNPGSTCTIRFYANDTRGNKNTSTTKEITITSNIDTTPPTVTATINATIIGENESINITVKTSDLSGISTIIIKTPSQNITMQPLTTGTYENITTPKKIGCGTGTCTIKFYANDTLGNVNSTTEINITVNTGTTLASTDTRPPTITEPYINNTNPYLTDNITIKITVTDESGVSKVFVSNKDTDIGQEMYNNTDLTSRYEARITPKSVQCPIGNCYLIFYANDTRGNTVKNFTITINVKQPPQQKIGTTNINTENIQQQTSNTNNQNIKQPDNKQEGQPEPQEEQESIDDEETKIQESPEESQKTPIWIIILFSTGGILLVAGIGIAIHQYGHKNGQGTIPEEQIEEQTVTLPPRKETIQEPTIIHPQQRGKIVLETYTGPQKTRQENMTAKPQMMNAQQRAPQQKTEEIPLAALRKRALVEKLFKKEEEKNKIFEESNPRIETLKKFINDSIKLGYHPKEIAHALIDKGWKLSDIEESFKEIGLTM